MEEAARRMLGKMNAIAVQKEKSGFENDRLARELGNARKKLQFATKLCFILVLTNALTLSTVWIFVTPDSFAAFREGIAMKLIRREAGYSMSALRMRNAFAVLVERILYETPKAMLSLLAMLTTSFLGLLSFFFSFFFAVATRSILKFNDGLALAFWALVANLCFLSDDFHIYPEKFFPVGGLALQVSFFILALPEISRLIVPPGRDHWRRCRKAILNRYRGPREETTEDTPPRVPAEPPLSMPKRVLITQRRRTSLYFSKLASTLFFLAFLAWCLDTAIVHE